MNLKEKIRKLSNKELLATAQQHKWECKVSTNFYLQNRYNLLLAELKRRNLLR